jgi:hypothetical protein
MLEYKTRLAASSKVMAWLCAILAACSMTWSFQAGRGIMMANGWSELETNWLAGVMAIGVGAIHYGMSRLLFEFIAPMEKSFRRRAYFPIVLGMLVLVCASSVPQAIVSGIGSARQQEGAHYIAQISAIGDKAETVAQSFNALKPLICAGEASMRVLRDKEQSGAFSGKKGVGAVYH